MPPAKAILIVWTDIPAADEDDFNEWYIREHVRSRVVDLPGFIRGRRFVALSGGPKYVALYEVEDICVFRSQPYLDLVAKPDPLSQRFIPKFHNVVRMVSDVAANAGDAEGGILGLQALTPIARRETEFQTWASQVLIPELASRRGVVAAHLWNVNAGILAESVSRHMRSGDRVFEWLVAIEGSSSEDVEAAHAKMLSAENLLANGAETASELTVCRTTYRVAPS